MSTPLIRSLILIIACFFIVYQSNSQGVGIGVQSPNPNAVLELVSPGSNQGFLVPKMTTEQRTASSFTSNLTSQENGLMVYDTDENTFYFWINSDWVSLQMNTNLLAGTGIEITDGEINNTGDLDPSNEIQSLSIAGSDLSLSNGGGTVTLPLGFSGDFGDLANVPSDLTDGDDVGITTESDPTVPANLKDGVDYSELTGTPTIPTNTSDLTNDSGFITSPDDADADENNEIQSLSLTGSDLSLSLGGGTVTLPSGFSGDFADLSGVPTDLADGDDFEANTDNQTATDVPVTPSGNLGSNNVQLALQELQVDVDNLTAGGSDGNDFVTSGNLSGTDLTLNIPNQTNPVIDLSGLDTDTQLSDGDIAGFGYIKSADLNDDSATNEIQDAGEVPVTPSGNLGSNNVQLALQELQVDVDNLTAGGSDGNDFVTSGNLAGTDLTLNIPNQTNPVIDLSGLDTDTQLTESEVDAFVNNNGYLIASDVAGYDTDATDDFSGDYNDLTNQPTLFSGDFGDLANLPADLADGDDFEANTDNQNATQVPVTPSGNLGSNNVQLALQELQIDVDNLTAGGSDGNDFVNAGTLTGTNLELDIPNQTNPIIDLAGLQDGFEANTDNQTADDVPVTPAGNLTSTDVQAALEEHQADIDGLAAGGSDGVISNVVLNTTDLEFTGSGGGFNGSVDLSGLDTDTQLTESEVDAFVNNNGYLVASDVAGYDTDATDDFSGDYNDLTNQPTLFSGDFGDLANLPADLADGDDFEANTDNQNATQVPVTPSGNLGSNNVQLALQELQIDVDNLTAGGSDGNDFVTSGNLAGTDLTLNIPNQTNPVIDLSGLDTDTQLSDGEIAGFGYIKSADLNDDSPTNEFQTLTQAGQTVTLSDGGGSFTLPVDTDTQLSDGDIAAFGYLKSADIVDNDADNETIEVFTIDGPNLLIREAGTNYEIPLTSLQDGTGTDNQTLAVSGTDLTISGGNAIPLASIQDGFQANTDEQDLSVSGGNLNISGGSGVALTELQDGTGTDNQTLAVSGTDLTISGGNAIPLASIQDGFQANTDEQDLSVSGGNLNISGGSGVALTELQDGTGTDDQEASEVNVTDAGGNFTNTEVEGVLEEIDNRIDALVLAGGSDGNDFVTGGSLTGTELTLEIPGQTNPTIELNGLQDGTGTDNQDLSVSGGNLNISGGSGVALTELQDGTGTDNQTLAVSGTDLTISGGNAIPLASIQDGFQANTDEQNLSVSGGNLNISGGSGVALTELQDGTGTDNQTLAVSGTDLTISGGNAIPLSSIQDGFQANTDEQDLSVSGGNLNISGGSGVALTELQDGTGTDNQTLAVSGTDLTISGGNAIPLSSIQDGFQANTDEQDLSVSGGNLNISGGSGVALTELQDGTGTDNQQIDVLNLSGTTLNISLEDDGQTTRTLDLSTLQDNTDAQTLSLNTDPVQLIISGGNALNISDWDLDTSDDFFLPKSESFNTGANILDLTNNGGGITAVFDRNNSSLSNPALRAYNGGLGPVVQFDHGSASSGDIIAEFNDRGNPVMTVRDDGLVTAGSFVGDGSGLTGLPSSQWTTLGSDIYYNGGGVGIGTTSPLELFEVSGSDGVRVASKITNLNGNGGAMLELENDDRSYDLAIGGSTGSFANSFYLYDWGNDINRLLISPTEFAYSNELGEEVLTIDDIDDVTIGNGTAGSDLYVNGITYADAFVGDGSGLTGLSSSPWNISGSNLNYTTGNIGVGTVNPYAFLSVKGAVAPGSNLNEGVFIDVHNDNGVVDYMTGIRFKVNSTDTDERYNAGVFYQNRGGGKIGFAIQPNQTENVGLNDFKMVIDDGGDVGIGTSTPSSKLDVDGTVTATAFVGDGSGLTNLPGGGSQWTGSGEINYTRSGVVNTSNAAVSINNSVTSANNNPGEKVGLLIESTGSFGAEGGTNIGLDVLVSGGNGINYAARFAGGRVLIEDELDIDENLRVDQNATISGTLRTDGPISVNDELRMGFSDAGTDGEILQSQGSGSRPAWVSPTLQVDLNASFSSDNIYFNPSAGINAPRFGIGTSSPARTLDVSNTSTNPGMRLNTSSTSGFSSAIDFVNPNQAFIAGLSGAGDFVLRDGTTFTGTNRLVINTVGNVGIGTSSPSARLDVLGTTELNGNTTIAGDVSFTQDTHTITFAAASSTTSPMVQMFSTGSANADRMVIAHSSSFSDWGLEYQDNGDQFNFKSGSNNVMTLELAERQVGIRNTAPNVELDVIGSIEYTGTISDVSDRRLKEGLKPIEDASDKLQKLKGYSYHMIDDSLKTREYGLMAQDVQAVLPYAVSVVDPENGYLGLAYTQLIPVLIEAHKEQQDTIKSLQLELAAMKKKLASSESSKASLQSQLDQQSTEIDAIKKALGLDTESHVANQD